MVGTYRKLPFPKKTAGPTRQPTVLRSLQKTDAVDGTIGRQGPSVRTGRLGTLVEGTEGRISDRHDRIMIEF